MHQRLGAGNKARTHPPDRHKKALVRLRGSSTGYAASQRADGGLRSCAPGRPAAASEIGRWGAVPCAVRRSLRSACRRGKAQRVILENRRRHMPAPGSGSGSGSGYRLPADACPTTCLAEPGRTSGRHPCPGAGPGRARSGPEARKRVAPDSSLFRCITRAVWPPRHPGAPCCPGSMLPSPEQDFLADRLGRLPHQHAGSPGAQNPVYVITYGFENGHFRDPGSRRLGEQSASREWMGAISSGLLAGIGQWGWASGATLS